MLLHKETVVKLVEAQRADLINNLELEISRLGTAASNDGPEEGVYPPWTWLALGCYGVCHMWTGLAVGWVGLLRW